jgi:hypothetical protein
MEVPIFYYFYTCRSSRNIVEYSSALVLEIKSVVHFQYKSFNSGCLLAYQLADVGGGPSDKGI